MIRAITSPELGYLRSHGQSSALGLAMPACNPIFQAQINQTFASLDQVVQIIFDTVTLGAYTDVLEGMTVWIGSEAGKFDIGQTRVRKAPTSTILYIGECSEIEFANNLYITVVQDWSIWARNLIVDESGDALIDWDIAYTDQHTNFNPFPVIGPDAVLELADAEVTLERDAFESFVPDSTITTHLWACASAASIDDATTSNPVFHFDATGTHIIQYTQGAANGKSTVTFRKVFVWDKNNPPITKFTISNFSGSIDSGLFEFEVTLEAEADSIRPRQEVILFAMKEFYGGTQISLGQVPGNENEICIGWIAEESIIPDSEHGTVTFTVKGPQYWLSNIPGFIVGIERSSGTAAAWTEIKDITIDKALHHFLYWQTTAVKCIDIFLTGDTKISPGTKVPNGNLWDQLRQISYDQILAAPRCDPLGRLFFEIDAQMLSDDDKDDLITVMEITKDDYEADSLNIDCAIHNQTSTVFLSGISIVAASTQPLTYFSLAPGHAPTGYGSPKILDKLLLSDQAEANGLAGRVLSADNNKFPKISFSLVANNRLISLVPRQVLQFSVSAADSPAGIAFSGKIIPKSINMDFDDSGIRFSLECEALTYQGLNTNGDIPVAPDGYELPSSPPFPNIKFDLPEIPVLSFVPGILPSLKYIILLTMSHGVWFTDEADKLSPRWWSWNVGLPSDVGRLNNIEITPDGHVYVQTSTEVFWGILGTARFYTLLDQAWLNTYYSPENLIDGIGVSRLEPNKLAVVAGSGYIGARTGNLWLGNHSGVTQKSVLPTGFIPGFANGRLTYGNGNWANTQTLAPTTSAAYAVYSGDGSIIVRYAGDLGRYHVRAGTGKTWYLENNSGALQITEDDGATVNPLGSGFVKSQFLSKLMRSYDCSPSGLRMMAIKNTDNFLYRSSDQGETFGTIPAFPADIQATCVKCIDEDRWIIGGRDIAFPFTAPKLAFTPDFGETWDTNILGNLATYLPSISSGILRMEVA